MSRGPDHWEVCPAPAPEAARLSAPQKVEHIEAGHQPQIAHRRSQPGRALGGEDQPQAGLRPRYHDQGHDHTEGQQQPLSPPEALPHPAFLPRSHVLPHEDGHRRCAAVSKGVGEALHPGGGGEGDDRLIPQGVHRPLDQQFADVQITHVEGGDKAEAGGAPEQGPVHHHIRPVEHQFREAQPQIEGAQPGGQDRKSVV